MPGAGKSTAAQLLALALRGSDRAVRWLYEEEVDHPLFGFHTPEDVAPLVTELRAGRFDEVVAGAVGRWRELARRLPTSGVTTIADGCLLGYLTWSLYWADAPRAAITGYLDEVAGILASVDSVVVHLRPEDVAESWRRLDDSRGAGWMRGAIDGVERSPAGRRMGLAGFDGLVRYWAGFLELADGLLGRLRRRCLVVPVGVGGEDAAQARMLELLGVTPRRFGLDRPAVDHAGRYVGEGGVAIEVGVVEGEDLNVAGLPGAWPRVPLLPIGQDTFALRSYPWEVRFTFDGEGHATALDIAGAPLLETAAPGRFVRAG
jgi:hypothetical protein